MILDSRWLVVGPPSVSCSSRTFSYARCFLVYTLVVETLASDRSLFLCDTYCSFTAVAHSSPMGQGRTRKFWDRIWYKVMRAWQFFWEYSCVYSLWYNVCLIPEWNWIEHSRSNSARLLNVCNCAMPCTSELIWTFRCSVVKTRKDLTADFMVIYGLLTFKISQCWCMSYQTHCVVCKVHVVLLMIWFSLNAVFITVCKESVKFSITHCVQVYFFFFLLISVFVCVTNNSLSWSFVKMLH